MNSRGSRTVLGARGGEIPPRDSTFASILPCPLPCSLSTTSDIPMTWMASDNFFGHADVMN